jgi:hypothetical protein
MMRDLRQTAGLCFALLAVMVQVTLATVVPRTSVSLADITALCQHDGDRTVPAAPAHPPTDCLLCAVCHAAPPAGLVAAPPWLPVPRTTTIARAAIPPPATAPPSTFFLAAAPRGPPVPT